jgi:VWFA-related protein
MGFRNCRRYFTVTKTSAARRFKTKAPALIVFGLMALLVGAVKDARSQIRVNTEVVVVPVTVRDADGEFVDGLTKDDFTILEDGKAQEISSFNKDPQPMSAAIVIDDGIGGIALHRVASQLQALASGFTSDDEVSVFRYSGVVDRLSDFSKDPKMMLQSFVIISKIAEDRPEEQAELITGGPGWLRSVLGIFPDGSKGTAKNHVLHNAIYEAATALQARPRGPRKVIFIVSDGVVAGHANTHSVKDNTELLLKNDIQVFAVSTAYASFGSYGALSTYANATGGEVHNGTTDESIEHAFNTVTEQARRQYILGYASTNTSTKPGAFRKIEVRTPQKNLKLTYRSGYTK